MRMMMVDELISGMIIAQDVLNQFDTTVLAAGIRLTDAHIKTLLQHDIDYVFVEEPKKASKLPSSTVQVLPEKLAKNEKRQKNVFRISVEYYKHIYESARAGRQIQYNEVYQVVSGLVQEFFKHDDVIRMLQRIETIDEYEFIHSSSVTILSVLIGKWLDLDHQRIYKLAIAAYLSDIGKCRVSQDVLIKTERLNEFENVQTKRHVDYSKNILEFSGGFDEDIINAVADHHERLNGVGYPDRKSRDDISLESKIIAVADTFHALMSDRPYREAYTVFESAEILWQLAYKELDPKVSERLIKFITAYFVGRRVILSDGRVGEIILVNPYDRFKPLIKVEEDFIDLAQDHTYKIVGVVSHTS